jgi:hypothetical protein
MILHFFFIITLYVRKGRKFVISGFVFPGIGFHAFSLTLARTGSGPEIFPGTPKNITTHYSEATLPYDLRHAVFQKHASGIIRGCPARDSP